MEQWTTPRAYIIRMNGYQMGQYIRASHQAMEREYAQYYAEQLAKFNAAKP